MRFTEFLASLSFSDHAWLPLADAVAKATVLLAIASVTSMMMRRGSAASRHLVWTLALVSALALPVLSMALPHWQIPLVMLTESRSADVSPSRDAPAARQSSGEGSQVSRAEDNQVAAAAPTADQATPAFQTAPDAIPASLPSLSIFTTVVMIWALGVAAILGRLALGFAAVQWMSRRTDQVTDAPWLPQARALAADLGVSPRIRFLRSGRAAMPMAWGLTRPVVLMPADADTWPPERLRIVLLHELAHVKRRDCLTHMLAQISCALYWFNPLAWIAARHVRTERERACDDLVLASGTRGADYADQLLEIARVMKSGRFPGVLAAASLAMAQRSQLEGRLMAILDPRVPRSGITPVRTMVATMVFACGLVPLASLQPWAFAAAPAIVSVPGDERDAQSATPAQTPTPTPAPTPTPDPMVARGAVRQGISEGFAGGVAGAFRDVVQAGVEGAVQGALQGTVQGVLQGVMANPDVQAAITSNVRNNINTSINTNVNTNVNANVNARAGKHNDHDQDEPKRKGADARTIAALTAALKDPDKDVRETALNALVQMRDPSIFEPLIQALSDAAADVREQAAFGLGQLHDRRAVTPLVGALRDAVADVREQAAFALGQLRDRSAVPGLVAAVRDSDADVREQAVFALGQLRDPAGYEAIASAVKDAKPDVRQQAVFALGQLRDRRAVEPLISALKDADADVRQQAAFGLGQLRDRGAVEPLMIALKDSDADVRQQAAFALGQIGDPRAIDGLTTALKDSSADVRQQAAFALGQLAR